MISSLSDDQEPQVIRSLTLEVIRVRVRVSLGLGLSPHLRCDDQQPHDQVQEEVERKQQADQASW